MEGGRIFGAFSRKNGAGRHHFPTPLPPQHKYMDHRNLKEPAWHQHSLFSLLTVHRAPEFSCKHRRTEVQISPYSKPTLTLLAPSASPPHFHTAGDTASLANAWFDAIYTQGGQRLAH